jgi:AcrR family transcriptional regulator
MTSAAIGAGTGDAGASERPGAGPERGYAKGRATREQILQAAIEVFGEVGYHAAALREIAARVGMSHPGLLHHFPTKAALLQAVLDERDRADAAEIEADVAAGTSVVDALLALVERNAGRKPVVELFTALSAEATSPDHPAHEYFVRRYETTRERLTGHLESCAETGLLREGVDPGAAARLLVAIMDGLQVQWLLALDAEPAHQVDMAADLRAYLRLVLVD